MYDEFEERMLQEIEGCLRGLVNEHNKLRIRPRLLAKQILKAATPEIDRLARENYKQGYEARPRGPKYDMYLSRHRPDRRQSKAPAEGAVDRSGTRTQSGEAPRPDSEPSAGAASAGEELIHHGSGTAADPDHYVVNSALLDAVERGQWNTVMLKSLVNWARICLNAHRPHVEDGPTANSRKVARPEIHPKAGDGNDVPY